MAKPLMPVEVILERSLALLDAEGAKALTTRRVAAVLGISTRTLYQQVGTRDELIRALVARHFAELQLEFHEYGDWETTATQWCLGLHKALLAHPFLTELMTVDDRAAVMNYVSALMKAALREGIPRAIAAECARALVNLTINHSVMEVRAQREPKLSGPSLAEVRRIEKNFLISIRWILAGVRADVDSGCDDPGRAADRTSPRMRRSASDSTSA